MKQMRHVTSHFFFLLRLLSSTLLKKTSLTSLKHTFFFFFFQKYGHLLEISPYDMSDAFVFVTFRHRVWLPFLKKAYVQLTYYVYYHEQYEREHLI